MSLSAGIAQEPVVRTGTGPGTGGRRPSKLPTIIELLACTGLGPRPRPDKARAALYLASVPQWAAARVRWCRLPRSRTPSRQRPTLGSVRSFCTISNVNEQMTHTTSLEDGYFGLNQQQLSTSVLGVGGLTDSRALQSPLHAPLPVPVWYLYLRFALCF